MKANAEYAWYLLRHKWYVLRAGVKTGVPFWRLLIHDWSKFTPAEWKPYVDTFYRDDVPGAVESFDMAWLHHQHHNPHHWQHWLLREDKGQVKVLEMPEVYVREMVADWAGAGRAITGKWEVAKWYLHNRDIIMLHRETRKLVDDLISEVFS